MLRIGFAGRGSRKSLGSGNGFSVEVEDELWRLVEHYAEERRVSVQQAIAELLEKGYEHYCLEKKFGDRILDREVWDRRFYYMKVEGGYLYYRMRLWEAVGEIRLLAMALAGAASSLEACYKLCGDKLENTEWRREVEKLRCTAEYYLKRYSREIKGDLEKNQRVPEEEVLESLEKTLEEYKKRFIEKRVE